MPLDQQAGSRTAVSWFATLNHMHSTASTTIDVIFGRTASDFAGCSYGVTCYDFGASNQIGVHTSRLCVGLHAMLFAMLCRVPALQRWASAALPERSSLAGRRAFSVAFDPAAGGAAMQEMPCGLADAVAAAQMQQLVLLHSGRTVSSSQR
jgi:hypothetical protein